MNAHGTHLVSDNTIKSSWSCSLVSSLYWWVYCAKRGDLWCRAPAHGCMLTRSITGWLLCAGSLGLAACCIIQAFEATHTLPLALCIGGGWGGVGPGGGATIFVCLVTNVKQGFQCKHTRCSITSPITLWSTELSWGPMSNRVPS